MLQLPTVEENKHKQKGVQNIAGNFGTIINYLSI